MFKFLSVDTNYKRQFGFPMLGTYIKTYTVYEMGAGGRFLATRIYLPTTTREAGWGVEEGNGD